MCHPPSVHPHSPSRIPRSAFSRGVERPQQLSAPGGLVHTKERELIKVMEWRGRWELNHEDQKEHQGKPNDCTSERRAPKFRRFLQLLSPSGVRKSAHASKILNVSPLSRRGLGFDTPREFVAAG